MIDHQVLRPAERTESGLTKIDFLTPDGEKTLEFSGIYASLVHASADNPAYSCIFGQVADRDGHLQRVKEGRGDIRLLTEIVSERLSQRDFLTQIRDGASEYGVVDFYGITEDEDRLRSFRQFMDSSGRRIDLIQGPYQDNLFLATEILNDWLRSSRLKLPNGALLRQQLRALRREDFQMPKEHLEARFYAVSAARYAVGVIHQQRPLTRYSIQLPSGSGGRFGWMSA